MRRRPVKASGVLFASAAVIAAVGVGLATTAGTWALWNSSASIAPATIVAGATGLTVTPVAAFPTTALAPGQVNRGAFSVTNTGGVPLALSVATLSGPSNTFAQALTVSVGVTSSANCTAGTYAAAWSGTFSTWSSATLSTTLAAGTSTTICLALALSSTVASGAQGQTASGIVVSLAGTQP